MDIDILGTKYTIFFRSAEEDKRFDYLDGYTDLYNKEIVICKMQSREYYKDETEEKIIKIEQKILRHELIHAFLYESGLDCNSNKSCNWAENEEMVDWFAIQSPKILKVYRELNIM